MTLMERVKVAEAECGSIASVSRDASVSYTHLTLPTNSLV